METPEALPLDKESSLGILSELIRSIELGIVTMNEEYQRIAPNYCKNFKGDIALIYRAALNVLAGLDQSASWLDMRDLCGKADSQKTCTQSKPDHHSNVHTHY